MDKINKYLSMKYVLNVIIVSPLFSHHNIKEIAKFSKHLLFIVFCWLWAPGLATTHIIFINGDVLHPVKDLWIIVSCSAFLDLSACSCSQRSIFMRVKTRWALDPVKIGD